MPSPLPRRDLLTQTGAGLAALVLAPHVRAAGNAKQAPIKVGQIGVGHAHAGKLSVFRDSPDYDVVGIVEPNDTLRESSKNKPPYRDLKWMSREQLLNTPGLQLVLVETAVASLLDHAEACINAGKHVHLDKPAGSSLPHFRRILEKAQAKHLLVQMGYMYRYNPGVVLLHELLDQGWLGEVFEVHAVMSKVVDPRSRKGLAAYSGGILFELGCHLMDLVIGILGRPDALTPFLKHVKAEQDDLMDNGLAVLSYPKATAGIRSSAVEVEGFSRRHLVVCGTEGTLEIQPLDRPTATLALSQSRGQFKKGVQTVPLPSYSRYVDDAADMARIIRGEATSRYSYEHDLNVQTALLQACEMPLE